MARAVLEYEVMMDSLSKRKLWSIEALQQQQHQIESVFLDLKRKIEGDFALTLKEVAGALTREQQEALRHSGCTGAVGEVWSMSRATRERVVSMMEQVHERQSSYVLQYQQRQVLTRVGAAAQATPAAAVGPLASHKLPALPKP